RSSKYNATDIAEIEPKTAANWRRERFRRYMRTSGDPLHPDQIPEHNVLQRERGRDSRIAAAAPIRQVLERGAVFVEGPRVPLAGLVVEVQLERRSGLRVAQFELTGPWRTAVLVCPQVEQHQLVAEIGEILQRALAALVIEEV